MVLKHQLMELKYLAVLADCSLNTYELQKGTFTLDFNGHTLKQINSFGVDGTANLTVKNDRSTAVENNGRFCRTESGRLSWKDIR